MMSWMSCYCRVVSKICEGRRSYEGCCVLLDVGAVFGVEVFDVGTVGFEAGGESVDALGFAFDTDVSASVFSVGVANGFTVERVEFGVAA